MSGNYQVIIAAPYWALNGVNTFSANLARGLRDRGIPAHIVFTEASPGFCNTSEAMMPIPSDLPAVPLPLPRFETWGGHWAAMIEYLEKHAPCVYIPNADWRHSNVSSDLSSGVSVVGVVHSDDPMHYDHVKRLGRYWDAVVTTSPRIAHAVEAIDSSLSSRLSVIPIGAPVPESPPKRCPQPGAPVRIIYQGVLRQWQKRILDLPPIIAALVERRTPIEVTVAGGGEEAGRLREMCQPFVDQGIVRFLGVVPHADALSLLEQQDVFLMMSEFEGMPNALIEAMGRGCVPVVTDVESGIPDVVHDGRNGFLVPVADIDAFADRISQLYRNLPLRQAMSAGAHQAVVDGGYRVEDMVDGYLRVFEQARADARQGRWVRPRARLAPPCRDIDGIPILPGPHFHDVWEAYLSLSPAGKPLRPLLMTEQLLRVIARNLEYRTRAKLHEMKGQA